MALLSMRAKRNIWKSFATVLGLSLLVFCTDLISLTYDQEEDNIVCAKYSKDLGNCLIAVFSYVIWHVLCGFYRINVSF